MNDSPSLKIDFGDGVSALDRTMRGIVMAAGEAVAHLEELGWKSSTISLEIREESPLPAFVTLNRRKVFEIDLTQGSSGLLKVKGRWIKKVSPPGLWARIRGHARVT